MPKPKPHGYEIDWRGVVARFLVDMEQLAFYYNGSITSGCRTPARNLQKGGHVDSKHTFAGGWGMARDFMFDTPEDRDAAFKEAKNKGWYPVILESYHPAQLHVQGWPFGVFPTWPTKEV